MAAIETRDLTRRFGETVAVDGVSLTVDQGEAFGFLGPNGAGKSTTISVLLGFLRPTAGEARVLGRDAVDASAAVRSRVGLLPEGYEPYANLTGREHVRSAVRTKGADDDPDAVLDRVGLDPADARRPAGDYSKGMQQRLFLGIALVGSPDLLVLDEPSSGLDPAGVGLLRELVAEEVDRGATVFFSSHDLDEVERVCDRVGIMRGGELVAVNAVEDLRSELGMGSVVEATLAEPPASVPLADVDGVSDYETDGRVVRAQCTEPPAKMRALAALDAVATVQDVGLEEPSLETVFEQYTGGADEGAEAVDPRDEPTESAAGASAESAATGGE
jgi:ABC-2 type transport system ATP-binding protein